MHQRLIVSKARRRDREIASTRRPSRPTMVEAVVSAFSTASSVASTVALSKGFRCVSARCVMTNVRSFG